MFHFRSLAFLVLALMPAPLLADSVTGSAFYRERIAAPPGATFTAVLQDISLADAPTQELGRFELTDAGNPPYDFEIAYDASAIDPRHTYAVRATLRVGDELWFTSDTVTPVITNGAPTEGIQIMMVRAAPGQSQAPQDDQRDVRGLTLPATFTGTLPCADCEGISHHLDLWPDHSYSLRRQWLGRDATAEGSELRQDAIGLWAGEPGTNVITLYDSAVPPLKFEVLDENTLRALDTAGEHIESDLPYNLTTDGTLAPTDIEGLLMNGFMVYMADAGSFQTCTSLQTMPIAMEGDAYVELERAYLEAVEGGQPLFVDVVGSLLMREQMEGPDRQSLVVEQFIRTRADVGTCDHQRANASLANTYWRIDTLQGQEVGPVDGGREPHIILHQGEEPRFAATVGCNQVLGGYATGGDRLTLMPGPMTLMACPPPLDAMERALVDTLTQVARFQIRGETMVLYDDADAVVAILTAVYL
ncbi:YbaY family lipoprotein [Pseudooceanicola sp. LIPI14-2-Ac024]|uniref:YbaY family lipoprotein n=1 Tax=Pseudooceanicola sp. LIPI14-2-Ac024 TaxID=3344875 RepID=UPI0035CFBD7A